MMHEVDTRSLVCSLNHGVSFGAHPQIISAAQQQARICLKLNFTIPLAKKATVADAI